MERVIKGVRVTININLSRKKGGYIDYPWDSCVTMGHQAKQTVRIITLPNKFKFD